MAPRAKTEKNDVGHIFLFRRSASLLFVFPACAARVCSTVPFGESQTCKHGFRLQGIINSITPKNVKGTFRDAIGIGFHLDFEANSRQALCVDLDAGLLKSAKNLRR